MLKKRRLVKAAASCHFIRGGWVDPNCASSQFLVSLSRAAWSILECARRTSTFSYQSMALPSSLASLSWKNTHVGLSAAVERGPSEGARSGSTEPTWVFFHPLYRARSASAGEPSSPPSHHAMGSLSIVHRDRHAHMWSSSPFAKVCCH